MRPLSHHAVGILFCALSALNSPAATYTANSLLQLANLANAALPGDTIQLASGTYSGAHLTFSANGTASQPITIRAVVPGGAKIEGNTSFTLTGSRLVLRGFHFRQIVHASGDTVENVVRLLGADFCTVTDNFFDRCGHNSNPTRHILRIEGGATDNLVSFNTFYDSTAMSSGVVVNTTGGNDQNLRSIFRGNLYTGIRGVDIVHPGQTNGMESIQVGQAGTFAALEPQTVIEYNRFENVTGDYNEIISVKASKTTVRYNTFEDCNASMMLRYGTQSVVTGNFFRNSLGGNLPQNRRVMVYGAGHVVSNNYFTGMTQMAVWLDSGYDSTHARAEDVWVANNTVAYSIQQGLRLGRSSTSSNPPLNCKLYNNLIRQAGGTAIRIYYESGTTYGANYLRLSDYAVAGVTTGGVFTHLDPQLTMVDGFHRPFSTILNNLGIALAAGIAVTEDMDGESRPVSPDIGADENVATASTPAPWRYVGAGDAGKSW